MFKQRLLTTLILIPLVIFLLYKAPYLVHKVIVLLLILAMGVEWLKLIPLENKALSLLFLLAILLGCYAISSIFAFWLMLGLLTWLLIFFFLLSFPQSQSYWGYPGVVAFYGFLFLPLAYQSLMTVLMLEAGKDLLLYLLSLVWGADIGAYLSGKLWGKHKLIPLVSPGKTLEGVLGGLAFTLLIAILGTLYFMPEKIMSWFITALAVFSASLLGDLFISMLKRRVALKDTGNLLPGHGGILDRLDSLIAAAGIFCASILIFPPWA